MQNGANGAAMAGQNGAMLPPGQQMKGVTQAQIQAALQNQQRLAALAASGQADPNLMLRAQRMAEQQRAAVMQQQQQQQQGGAGSPGQQQAQVAAAMRNGANGMNQQAFAGNQNMAAAANYVNGQQANGMHLANGANGANGAAPAQRMPTQVPPGIMMQLNQLETQLRAKHPNLTPEQARALAAEQLTRVMQQQRAMNSAAGNAGIANSIAATSSPQQYAALLRQQQQQQAAAQAQQQAGQAGQGQQQQRPTAAQIQQAKAQAQAKQLAQQQAAAQQAAQQRQSSGTPASDK